MLIPKAVFGIEGFASADPTRYQLNGVYFHRGPEGQARAVATDGKILGITEWSEHQWEEMPGPADAAPQGPRADFGAIIPSTDVVALGKAIPKANGKPILGNAYLDEHGNGKVEAFTTDIETTTRRTIRPIEGMFPNYTQVVPGADSAPVVTLKFNPFYLIEALQALVKVMELKPRDEAPTVELEFREPGKPVVFKAESTALGRKATALVMPLVTK